jgi:uncharacterized protein
MVIQTIDWQEVYHYVGERLSTQLSASLTYHSINHTLQDVLPAAEMLGKMAGLDDERHLLLRTAALFHDIGYTQQYDQHELASVRIAGQVLPGFGYRAEQVQEIEKIILVTQLPQTPRNLVEELMCDADLDSLGRDDFFATCHNLLHELRALGLGLTLKQWYEQQRSFLSSHRYFTQYAEGLRGPGKRANIATLEKYIQSLDGSEIDPLF